MREFSCQTGIHTDGRFEDDSITQEQSPKPAGPSVPIEIHGELEARSKVLALIASKIDEGIHLGAGAIAFVALNRFAREGDIIAPFSELHG